ncbi:NBR1-Ig-like domain-containing protein [Herbidospora yilanensis]|uniref:NBR1-Ig-like domain-containing protein n=1 Tax=Herbidospora yilanensis TaxID=354426 RepID=UPI0007831D3E|nr:NBR1-Ig-like domain-containing protein [Herbidospora yilanensis]
MRHAGGDRRGRRPNRPDPDSGPVEAFADRLWQLKIAAGDPSFAEMCAQGAAASKSSLAAAAQGRTLPSWGVTWEFVRVLAVARLGHDPAAAEREWRTHWTRAKALADLALLLPEGGQDRPDDTIAPPYPRTSTGSGPASAQSGTSAATPPSWRHPDDAASGVSALSTPLSAGTTARDGHATSSPEGDLREPGSPGPRRFRPKVLAAALVAVAVAVAGAVLFNGGSPKPRVVTPIALDESVFEADVTIPDGTLVGKGESFEKVWRIKNTGGVEWAGRFLMRVNDTVCAAPRRVEIPHTPPGRSVDIRVTVEAPEKPGACKIFWKMVDAEGRLLFPDKRPIFLDVRVS